MPRAQAASLLWLPSRVSCSQGDAAQRASGKESQAREHRPRARQEQTRPRSGSAEGEWEKGLVMVMVIAAFH